MFLGRAHAGAAAAPLFGEAVCFLQPSYAHTLEEKRRQALEREQIEEGSPPLVDLDAGVIRLQAGPRETALPVVGEG